MRLGSRPYVAPQMETVPVFTPKAVSVVRKIPAMRPLVCKGSCKQQYPEALKLGQPGRRVLQLPS